MSKVRLSLILIVASICVLTLNFVEVNKMEHDVIRKATTEVLHRECWSSCSIGIMSENDGVFSIVAFGWPHGPGSHVFLEIDSELQLISYEYGK